MTLTLISTITPLKFFKIDFFGIPKSIYDHNKCSKIRTIVLSYEVSTLKQQLPKDDRIRIYRSLLVQELSGYTPFY